MNFTSTSLLLQTASLVMANMQAEPKRAERVNKLLDILLRRDHKLLPMFCDMLTATGQQHIVQILRKNGQCVKLHSICILRNL